MLNQRYYSQRASFCQRIRTFVQILYVYLPKYLISLREHLVKICYHSRQIIQEGSVKLYVIEISENHDHVRMTSGVYQKIFNYLRMRSLLCKHKGKATKLLFLIVFSIL